MASNVVASQPPERWLTGMLTARASNLGMYGRLIPLAFIIIGVSQNTITFQFTGEGEEDNLLAVVWFLVHEHLSEVVPHVIHDSKNLL